MKEEKSKNSGRIPISVLNNLNEFCNGGFICFYFNSENGMPEHAMTFDAPIFALGMQKYVTDWVDSLRDLNIEATKQQILDQQEDQDDEKGE